MFDYSCELEADTGDLQLSVVLAMTGLLAIVLATTELDDADLVVTTVADHFSLHLGTGNHRGTDLDVVAIDNHQDIVKAERLADFMLQQLDLQCLALGDTMLLATALDNRVHKQLHEDLCRIRPGCCTGRDPVWRRPGKGNSQGAQFYGKPPASASRQAKAESGHGLTRISPGRVALRARGC